MYPNCVKKKNVFGIEFYVYFFSPDSCIYVDYYSATTVFMQVFALYLWPLCFFQFLTSLYNSCVQSADLTGVIIIIPSLSLLEHRTRRNSNKSSNSLLLNRVANFSYLFFFFFFRHQTLWLHTNLIWIIFRYFFFF